MVLIFSMDQSTMSLPNLRILNPRHAEKNNIASVGIEE
jgi:hypothetical protein